MRVDSHNAYYEYNNYGQGKFPSPQQLLNSRTTITTSTPTTTIINRNTQQRRRIIRIALLFCIALICLSYCFAQIIISVSVIISSPSSSSLDYDEEAEQRKFRISEECHGSSNQGNNIDTLAMKNVSAATIDTAAAAAATSQRLRHVEEENEEDETKTNNIYNYRINPQNFIEAYKSCLMDHTKYCHTYYLHIQKTGGTTIEYNLDHIHYKGGGSTCCDEKLLEEFNLNPSKFCFASFQSYQILPKKLPYIIQKCQSLYDQTYYLEEEKLLLINQTTLSARNITTSSSSSSQPQRQRQRHRIQILISIREPISRTLSLIHQQCNRNPRRRPQQLIQACNRCNYYDNNDTKVWDQFVFRTNEEYQDLFGLLSQRRIITDPSSNNHPLIKSNILTNNIREKPSTSMINMKNNSDKMAFFYKNKNNNAAGKKITTTTTITTIPDDIPILILDIEDLNSFFTTLKADLPEFFRQRFPKRTSSHNKEILSRCKFQLSTEMIKSISNSSSKSYRNITFAGLEQQ